MKKKGASLGACEFGGSPYASKVNTMRLQVANEVSLLDCWLHENGREEGPHTEISSCWRD